MEVYLCSHGAGGIHKVAAAAERLPCPVLLLREGAVKTGVELEAAFLLARDSFREKTNISNKLSNEALLFLACETNFSSALRKVGATDAGKLVVAVEGKMGAAELKRKLKLTSAKKLALPKLGKKKGHYFEGELAAERMALARVRN
jgi:tRNA threonylcarbamoyladenosine modification (KEOPS) complex Cgi121 subunit